MTEKTAETGRSYTVEELMRESQLVRERYFPANWRIQQNGSATPFELATLLDTVDEATCRDFASECNRLAEAEPVVAPGDRLSMISARLIKLGLQEDAFTYYGTRQRPLYNLQHEVGAIDLIETVENILKGRPYSSSVKHVLLKKRIHTMLTEHPDRVERAVDFFTSKGLTSQEKSATLAVLDDIVDDDAYSTKIRGLWEREFEDEQRETPADDEAIDTQDWFVQWKKDLKNVDINEAIKSYRQRMVHVREVIDKHESRRDNRWGIEALDQYFALLGIPHSGEQLLGWSGDNLHAFTTALNEVGKSLVPEAKSWQEAWDALPIMEGYANGDLLDHYRKTTDSIVRTMVDIGLSPPIPQGDTYEIDIASPEKTRYFPKGYMMPPGYYERPKNVRVYLPDPHVFSDIYRELLLDPEIFAAHEIGAHALQQYYRDKLPEFVTNVNSSIILGLEGHAFSTELAAFEEKVMNQSLTNFFAILRGRQQRAARAVFALTYHLSRDSQELAARFKGMNEKEIADKLIDDYARTVGLGRKQAASDAGRGMENPFWLMAYYVGAAGAERYARIAKTQGLSRRDAMRQWVEHGGAHLPAHLQAYYEGWIGDPSDGKDFNWLVPDRAVELWNRYKQTGSFSFA